MREGGREPDRQGDNQERVMGSAHTINAKGFVTSRAQRKGEGRRGERGEEGKIEGRRERQGVRIRPPDSTRRQRPTIPPLFHSKSLNCNLWYLLDLLSNQNFEIAPFPLSLRLHQQDPISHTRRDHISRPTATSSWSRRFL